MSVSFALALIMLWLEVQHFRTMNDQFDDIFLKFGRGSNAYAKEIEKVNEKILKVITDSIKSQILTMGNISAVNKSDMSITQKTLDKVASAFNDEGEENIE